MKKVLLSGCNGHMGKIVHRLIGEHPNFEVVCGFDLTTTPALQYPVYENVEDLAANIGVSFERPDVIIDFSLPSGTANILGFAKSNGVPIVIATTGIEDYMTNVREASEDIPVFQSANMSFEVALLKWALQMISPKLSDTDIEITETHHNRKADAPSGTALLLANAISESFDEERDIVYGRTGKRDAHEIGIASLRGGNIPGTHTVHFFGQFETLEITHTVHSRDVFASGAIKAAEFILGQSPGLYSMKDMIK